MRHYQHMVWAKVQRQHEVKNAVSVSWVEIERVPKKVAQNIPHYTYRVKALIIICKYVPMHRLIVGIRPVTSRHVYMVIIRQGIRMLPASNSDKKR